LRIFFKTLIISTLIQAFFFQIKKAFLLHDTFWGGFLAAGYRSDDKSLARPGRKQTAPVKSVMGRGMD